MFVNVGRHCRVLSILCASLFCAINVSASSRDAPAEPPTLQPILLGLPEQAKDHIQDYPRGPYKRLKNALHTLGYELKIGFYPSVRSLSLASQGEIDGVMARPTSIEADFSDLVRVPTPILQLTPTIYSLSPLSWQEESIQTLGVARVSRAINQAMPAELASAKRVHTNTVKQMLQLLNTGRVDAILITQEQLPMHRKLHPQLTRKLISAKPPLTPMNFHTYLNKSHAQLVPKLDRLLQNSGLQKPLTANGDD